MANPEHVKVVKKGAQVLARWRQEHPNARLDLTDADLSSAPMSHAVLSGANLNHANLRGADLQDANLSGATLTGADLRKCKMIGATVRDANFRAAKYLFGPDRANLEDVKDAEFATYSYRRDWIPWSRLRSISTLRIFGASYGAFIAITVYVLLSKYWNIKLIGLHDWATKHKHDVSIQFWTGLVERIPPLPVPNRLGWQLIMLGFLALGATLYALFCPEIIKEATESRWTRELKQPLIEYRSAMYSGIIRRYVCAVCYGVGGLYTLGYIALRGFDAIRYLMMR